MAFNWNRTMRQNAFSQEDIDRFFASIRAVVTDIEAFRARAPADAKRLQQTLDLMQYDLQELYDDTFMILTNSSSKSQRLIAQQRSTEASSRGDILAGVEHGVLATRELSIALETIERMTSAVATRIITQLSLRVLRFSTPEIEPAAGKFVVLLQKRADAMEKASLGIRAFELGQRRRP